MAENRKRLRLAYCSPLPPQPIGIADYSAELLPALSQRFEIELFTSNGYLPHRELTRRFRTRTVAELAGAGEYDAIVYHLGNSAPFHGEIYEMALSRPGIVVLHEFMLHHLIRDLTLATGNESYLEQMRYCYGPGGYRTGKWFLEIGAGRDLWAYPLFERVVDRSLGVVVHNETARRRILASRPQAAVEVVPYFLSAATGVDETAGSRAALRRSLGLPADGLLVASFGVFTEAKRLEVALRAFTRFQQRQPDACFVLVGDDQRHPGLPSLLASEAGGGVLATGRLPASRFMDHMRVADLAIHLRFPSAGETSGTLIRLMGFGNPAIVSDTGWFAEIADGCCAKVRVDRHEESDLLAALLTLAEEPDLRRAMGASAREWVESRHSMGGAVEAWSEAIARIARDGRGPRRAVPPLAAAPPGDIGSALIGAVGAGLEDLGVAGDDAELIDGIAERITDLRLN